MSTALPLVTIDVAFQLYQTGRPFRVLVCYRGWTDNGNRSDKWWSLTYDGKSSTIECNYGKTGSSGTRRPPQYAWGKARDKCQEKLRKGYNYAPSTRSTVPPAPKPKPKMVLEGIFAEIRGLVEVGDDHFEAYGKDGLYLLDLTESGAEQVAAADNLRITMTRLSA